MSALDGKVAVITGASRGIGRAVAVKLGEAGARVVRLARTLGTGGGTGTAEIEHALDIACDITDAADLLRAAERVRESAGTPDILVNNAGGFLLKPFLQTSADDFRAQIEVNLVGAFGVLKTFLPMMSDRGGHVVTIGSVADHVPFPGNAAYSASKFGLRGLHEVLQAEYAGSGLRITLISPGPTDTALWDPIGPDRRDDLPNRSAMLTPEDVADAVLYAVTRSSRAVVDLIRLSAG